MLDSLLGLLAQQVAEYTTTGEVAGRVGNLSPSRKPTADLFQGRDGFIYVAIDDSQGKPTPIIRLEPIARR